MGHEDEDAEREEGDFETAGFEVGDGVEGRARFVPCVVLHVVGIGVRVGVSAVRENDGVAVISVVVVVVGLGVGLDGEGKAATTAPWVDPFVKGSRRLVGSRSVFFEVLESDPHVRRTGGGLV